MKRRVTSVLLALCLVLTMLPLGGLTAFAAENADVVRIAGDNRYETAYDAADMLKIQLGVDKFGTIVVASGLDFADALSGSYLAAVKQAPILLVNQHFMDDTAAYISENLAAGGKVYLLGGVNAVSAEMEAQLPGLDVERLAGANRLETNLSILAEAGVGDEEILVCYSHGFADSLSASAVGKPILMVNRGLTDAQKAFLATTDRKFVIIGGVNAVSADIEAQLQELGTTERIGGANRYETSVNVAKRFFDDPDAVVLAYGANFPDGLCGGALACAMGAPLILTVDGREAAAADYVLENVIRAGIVLGGTDLISDETIENIFGSLPPEETEPEVTEPEETEPEETEPEETEPEETEPEETEPEETEPEVTEPEETTPEETEPEVTEPEETVPEEPESLPEVALPNVDNGEIPEGAIVVDLTEKLDNLMHQNAEVMRQVLAERGQLRAQIFFYEMVKDGGDWDIKLTDEWKFEEGKYYVYRGVNLRMDDPGNIHFGYTGMVVFTEEFLCFGAGVNNVSKFGFSAGDFESYYDDPQDQEMMRWGCRLYEAGY